MDESIALVEFSKHSERVWSKSFDYAHIEVGLKIWNPHRWTGVDHGDDDADDHRRLSDGAHPSLFGLRLRRHDVTLHFVVNDVLMTLFFGLAVKEIAEAFQPGGSLYPPTRKAVNPLCGTVGGVLGPIAAYLAILAAAKAVPGLLADDFGTLAKGWGIPTATDISIAWVTALCVFGAGHPAINFLLLCAIIDDGIGLVIIAVAYRESDPAVAPAYAYLLLCLAAMGVALQMGIGDAQIREALEGFGGVKRRFTHVGDWNGVSLYDDYGHHPVEIAAVLQAARSATQGRTIAVVQPHRYTRLHNLFDEFCACFNDADAVIVADVYEAGEKPIEGASRDALVQGLRDRGHRDAMPLDGPEALPGLIARVAQPGDLVVCLGAGSITYWANALPDDLAKLDAKGKKKAPAKKASAKTKKPGRKK